jgi:UDP-3-O-[3-hydroxymyristoyl] glucosamine N-acyltransferase
MTSSIASTADVSERAQLGENVTIGHGTIVHDNVVIGDNTRIDEFCVIGNDTGASQPPLTLGAHSRIRSHSVIYEGSTFGDRLETGHHVLLRAGANVGVNFRIGSYSSLEGAMNIGDYCRFQGGVQAGPGSQLGDFVWIFSNVVLTNDPLPPSHLFRPVTIEDGAVVALGAMTLPGCHIGKGSFVAAGARVSTQIPAGVFVTGDNTIAGPVTKLMDLQAGTRHPWMRHFADVFPDDAQSRISALHEEVLSAAKEWRNQHQSVSVRNAKPANV